MSVGRHNTLSRSAAAGRTGPGTGRRRRRRRRTTNRAGVVAADAEEEESMLKNCGTLRMLIATMTEEVDG
jgi:hypothetical protein